MQRGNRPHGFTEPGSTELGYLRRSQRLMTIPRIRGLNIQGSSPSWRKVIPFLDRIPLPTFFPFLSISNVRWKNFPVTLDESWLRTKWSNARTRRMYSDYRFIGIVPPFIRIINAPTYKGSVGELTSLFMRPHEHALNTAKCSPGFASSPEYRQRGIICIYKAYLASFKLIRIELKLINLTFLKIQL